MREMTMQGRRAAFPDRQADDAGSEIRLMQAARADPVLFAPLYERYFPRIYAYCWRRLGGADDAEDVTSLIFTRALSSLGDYRGGMVAAWLFRIAHNAVINYRRDHRLHVSLDAAEFDLPDDGLTPIEGLEQAEERRAIRALVAALPEEQQDLLALKLVGGLTSEEIGEALGKSAGAVRVELHRIVQKLRERFQETRTGGGQ